MDDEDQDRQENHPIALRRALQGVRTTVSMLRAIKGERAPRSTAALVALLEEWVVRAGESLGPASDGPPDDASGHLATIRAMHDQVVPTMETIAYDLVREADPKVGRALIILAGEIDRSMTRAETLLTEPQVSGGG